METASAYAETREEQSERVEIAEPLTNHTSDNAYDDRNDEVHENELPKLLTTSTSVEVNVVLEDYFFEIRDVLFHFLIEIYSSWKS